jgi:hypothetical protein
MGAGARTRDAVFDAMLVACGMPLTGLTKPERGRVAAALRDIRAALPEDIAAEDLAQMIASRAVRYKQEWPKAELTPSALAANWSRFGEKNAARVTQGIAEPTWDWRAVAGAMGLPAKHWAELERGDKVRVMRAHGGITKSE